MAEGQGETLDIHRRYRSLSASLKVMRTSWQCCVHIIFQTSLLALFIF